MTLHREVAPELACATRQCPAWGFFLRGLPEADSVVTPTFRGGTDHPRGQPPAQGSRSKVAGAGRTPRPHPSPGHCAVPTRPLPGLLSVVSLAKRPVPDSCGVSPAHTRKPVPPELCPTAPPLSPRAEGQTLPRPLWNCHHQALPLHPLLPRFLRQPLGSLPPRLTAGTRI